MIYVFFEPQPKYPM